MSRFYRAEEEQTLRFYQMPKVLFSNPKYGNLSLGAKATYSILRDRQDLSIKNKWIDENGYIYLVFDGESLGNLLQTTRQTARKYIKELEKFGLVVDKRLGQGKANRLYILKPEFKTSDVYTIDRHKAETVENTEMLSMLTSRSKEMKHQNVNLFNTIDTDFIDTDFIDTSVSLQNKHLDRQTDQIEIEKIIMNSELLNLKNDPKYKSLIHATELTIKEMYFSPGITVEGRNIPQNIVRSSLNKLNIFILQYALNRFNEVSKKQKIENKKAYLKSCIYNAVFEESLNNHAEANYALNS